MTHHDIVYLSGQIINIVFFLILIVFISSQYRKKQLGLYHALVRALFYKDFSELRWFNNNPIYLYYLVLNLCLLMTEAGMLQQISDGSVYTKPVIFFFSNVGLTISFILVFSELYKKINQLEKT